jgi:hypothetical protein
MDGTLAAQAVPFGLGVASEVLIQLSWWLALRRGFRYDAERREASWLEAGERRTYKCPAEPGAAPIPDRDSGPGSS